MKKSDFQFSDPRILESEFYINEDFFSRYEEDSDFDGFTINRKVNTFVNEDDTDGMVSLELELGERDGDSPFYIRVVNIANFKCDDPNIFKKLIKTNAPALLLSYIRPYIAFITSQSGFEPINIPYMNFTETEETQE